MRSHRLALTTLLVAGSVLAAAGCGSGRDTDAFLPQDQAATPAAASGSEPPPPVVIAGPEQEVLDQRDRAKAAAAAHATAAEEAEQKRRAARRKLRAEREQAERARRRAAAREARLREELAAAERRRAAAATPEPDPPPTGSSVEGGPGLTAERNRRSAAEARAAVIRVHQLLDARDPRACDAITPRLLAATYGREDGALERCRTTVGEITTDVSVVVDRSEANGRRATVWMVSRMFDTDVFQTMHLVLVNGSWLVDRAERQPSR